MSIDLDSTEKTGVIAVSPQAKTEFQPPNKSSGMKSIAKTRISHRRRLEMELCVIILMT